MLDLAGRQISYHDAVFIIAEISCNHMGSLDHARELVDAAAAAGADAVKLQTWMHPSELAPDSEDDRFRLTRGPWAGRRLYDLYTEAWTPPEWHAELFTRARQLGLVPCSTPQSPAAVRFLETLDCPAYKVASAEIGYRPLLDAIHATGKPVIVSTGMATDVEVRAAVDVFGVVALLHCVSAYPAPAQQMNLQRIWRLEDLGRDRCPVGLSDHSTGNIASIAAVTLGARIIERHIMLDGTTPLDRGFSLTPTAFAAFVDAVRMTEAALAAPTADVEAASRQFKRRYVDGHWWRCNG